MRCRSSMLLVLLAACGGGAAPWAEPPSLPIDLKIAVSATKVPLLQPVTVQLDLYRRADLEVEWNPTVDAKDFLAEITTAAEVPFGAGRWSHTTIVLRPVRGPGELVLPPFVAKAKDGSVSASTAEQKFVVESVLGEHGAAIEAPGEPFPAPSRLGWWLAGGALLVALATAVLFAWRRRQRLRPHPEAVAVPAHVRALRALARLRSAPRTTPAQVEGFYVEVSQVLRVYLEERFGLRAPERTTEEFLRELESGDQLAREHRRELERFLSQCDLVKFAAVVPGEAEHTATFGLAEAFVESTRADRAARPAAPPTDRTPAEVTA
ncbi:MAG TPA: DUF4381 family protein [Planctomycetota bacterium]|nr:DUF4381 family protein [Planctomycetota bacterium]